MKHRHLDVASGTPPDELPVAAIVDILERGDLDDWRPIAAAIAREPMGELAARVMSLANARPMYGTSSLWRAFIDRCRARSEALPHQRQRRGASLSELRREHCLTQAGLARRLGISQSDLSKLERRQDLRLSSLTSYVAALGGRLRLLFESQHGAVEIRPPAAEARRRSDGGDPAAQSRYE